MNYQRNKFQLTAPISESSAFTYSAKTIRQGTNFTLATSSKQNKERDLSKIRSILNICLSMRLHLPPVKEKCTSRFTKR
ncbi:11485_t:CDS:2 [Funneliformis mosseae]|uniref:11485_t:CDS:1 n=1 Tax=Funneliformis mosseae TaxID=27381 RepID=A0A9N9D4B3_FUNMO|nr:11485_t:CDS:2 [Funneliformis mosseae]